MYMKLNAVAEMIPISWREFAEPHPFVPIGQMDGLGPFYRFKKLVKINYWIFRVSFNQMLGQVNMLA